MSYRTNEEIRDYLDRFKDTTPEERLRIIGAMARFFYENMIPQSRDRFDKSLLENKLDPAYGKGN